MNRMPVLVIGIFLTFLSSWLGLVAYPYFTLGRFTPVTDEETGDINPPPLSGLAERGQQVYASAGCVYCHSQQVRQVGYGSDLERGWGARPTVARDYMRENPAFLGTMRTGPDLTNIGARQPSEMWHHQHLYWTEYCTCHWRSRWSNWTSITKWKFPSRYCWIKHTIYLLCK
jgi:cytochrome c oxidase cbb3-type subunit 2